MGWTSTDAAGTPVFPGLATYYEAGVLGVIRHALRFTVQRSQAAYLYPPATHYASSQTNPSLPPMGMRLRLRATYNCTSALATAPQARAICVALQLHGMILADNGGDGAISGLADPRWDDADLARLRSIPLSLFDVVETGAVLCTDPECSASAFSGGAVGAFS